VPALRLAAAAEVGYAHAIGRQAAGLNTTLTCVQAGTATASCRQRPTLLALVSRAAPANVNATMTGVVFTSLFVANLIGWIGGFYEKMRPAGFWGMHAAIGATGGVLVPLRPSAQTLEVER
jgi:hypothetical protein